MFFISKSSQSTLEERTCPTQTSAANVIAATSQTGLMRTLTSYRPSKSRVDLNVKTPHFVAAAPIQFDRQGCLWPTDKLYAVAGMKTIEAEIAYSRSHLSFIKKQAPIQRRPNPIP